MDFEIFAGSNTQFVFQLMYLVIFLGAFTWAANIIIADLRAGYKRLFIELPRRRRSKEMIKRARKVGCVAVVNSEKGYTAVCSRREFDNALSLEKSKLGKEEDVRKMLKLSLTASLVLPFPTFVFASADEGNQYVTGTDLDLEILGARIVQKATGYSRDEVYTETFRVVRSILFRKDKRLLVPFVREGHMPNGELMPSMESQVMACGGKTMKEATDRLLSYI